MKIFLTTTLALLISSSAFSQKKDGTKATADAAVKSFTWDYTKRTERNLNVS